MSLVSLQYATFDGISVEEAKSNTFESYLNNQFIQNGELRSTILFLIPTSKPYKNAFKNLKKKLFNEHVWLVSDNPYYFSIKMVSQRLKTMKMFSAVDLVKKDLVEESSRGVVLFSKVEIEK